MAPGSEDEDAPPPTAPKPTLDSELPLWILDAQNVFMLSLFWRLINAFTLRTFFQPDEHYQVLEPAWQLAFGREGKAWITWEWQQRLRSSIPPAVFAAAYIAADRLAAAVAANPETRTQALLAAPKVIGALSATTVDYFTWRLAQKIYSEENGRSECLALFALTSSLLNPWNWFVSTRTFSNCLETALTVLALSRWPWTWLRPTQIADSKSTIKPKTNAEAGALRAALFYAAVATIIRPTNVIIWMIIIFSHLVMMLAGMLREERGSDVRAARHRTLMDNLSTLIREGILAGGLVLSLSAYVDRLFYQEWTFPPANFLHFNVIQGLAGFYGTNRLLYYFTEGYGLLLTVFAPFFFAALWRIRSDSSSSAVHAQTKLRLSVLHFVCLGLPSALTALAHKEVRFIYPILPAIHVVAARPLVNFFARSSIPVQSSKVSTKLSFMRITSGILMIVISVCIMTYTSFIHNSGIIAVSDMVRTDFEIEYGLNRFNTEHNTRRPRNMTVAFLMPCHSVPWRSHFQHPPTWNSTGIKAWALTCEPPLHLVDRQEKASYLDEADIFYANPKSWIKLNMDRNVPMPSGSKAGIYVDAREQQRNARNKQIVGPASVEEYESLDITDLLPLLQHQPLEHPLITGLNQVRTPRRPWPDYLVFFEHLEPVLVQMLRGSAYVHVARIFNSHWHDDWRRQGAVVVLKLKAEQAAAAWRQFDDAHREPWRVDAKAAEVKSPQRVVAERPGTQTVVQR